MADLRVTVAMPVHNEAGRYLTEALLGCLCYADQVVLLDDHSTDGGADEAARLSPRVSVHRAPEGVSFDNEVRLRRHLWALAAGTRPDWIVALDADEVMEPGGAEHFRGLLEQMHAAGYGSVAFRLFDLWDDRRHYRDDALWNAHKRAWTLAVRYLPDFPYQWREQAHHCGRLPRNAAQGPAAFCSIRIQHLGWLHPADRARKAERYRKLDPLGAWGSAAQYASILDPAPNLAEWED
jgi:hypothetical protein